MKGEEDRKTGADAGMHGALPTSAEPAHTAQAAFKEISGTVATLRLDAVLALGYGLSRSRAVLLVKGGLVQLNGRSVESPSCKVNEGDLIALQGRGSLEIAGLTGKSRKGRTGLNLKKFAQ